MYSLRKENEKILTRKRFLLRLLLIWRANMDTAFLLSTSGELRFYWGKCNINSLSHQFKAIPFKLKVCSVSTMLTFTNSVGPLLSWSWWISLSEMILMSYKSASCLFFSLKSVLVDYRNKLAEIFCPILDSKSAEKE